MAARLFLWACFFLASIAALHGGGLLESLCAARQKAHTKKERGLCRRLDDANSARTTKKKEKTS